MERPVSPFSWTEPAEGPIGPAATDVDIYFLCFYKIEF